jgi:hypothetical protein
MNSKIVLFLQKCKNFRNLFLSLNSPILRSIRFQSSNKQKSELLGFWTCPSTNILEPGNTTSQKLDPWPSSGEEGETPTMLGPLERADLNHWTSPVFLRDPNEQVTPPRYLRTETDPASETLCFLVSRIPDDEQSPKTH